MNWSDRAVSGQRTASPVTRVSAMRKCRTSDRRSSDGPTSVTAIHARVGGGNRTVGTVKLRPNMEARSFRVYWGALLWRNTNEFLSGGTYPAR